MSKRVPPKAVVMTAWIGGLVAAAVLVAACGGGSTSDNGGQQSGGTDQTCFTALNPDQKSQLVDYVNGQQNSQVQNTTDNGDGTQDVCVLESDGNGGYNERYYNRNDGFSDYLLYSTMFGHSNVLLGAALLSDDGLDVGDYLALSLLTGVNGSGGLYHPYGHTNAGWGRSNTAVQNTHVTNVYYGSTNAGSYDQVRNKKPPANYAPAPLQTTNNNDNEATVTRGADGKLALKVTSTTGASAALRTATVVAPTPLKALSSAPTVQNPARADAAASATATATAAAPTTAVASTRPTTAVPTTSRTSVQTTPRTTAQQQTSQRTSQRTSPAQRPPSSTPRKKTCPRSKPNC